MGEFLKEQKKSQARWRKRTPWLSARAQQCEGRYSKSGNGPYDFCLPLDCAEQNLFPDISAKALAYFENPPGAFGGGRPIHWHDGQGHRPSTHLCDSQVCCVNFLFPFIDHQEAATRLLASVFDECDHAIPVTADAGNLVEFEWLGNPASNMLGEGSGRQRGANATSMDAAMCFVDSNGGRHLVLIEWKYTESYQGSEKIAQGKFDEKQSGKTRKERYGNLYYAKGSPVKPGKIRLEHLGYEPFYQFLRQQLLAQAFEPCFSSARVLHISPRANLDLALITPEPLRHAHPSLTATQAWRRLLRRPDRFVPVYVEDFIAPIIAAPPTGLERWADYIGERYAFVRGEQ